MIYTVLIDRFEGDCMYDQDSTFKSSKVLKVACICSLFKCLPILAYMCGIVTLLDIQRYIRYTLLPFSVDMHSLNWTN